MLHQHVLLRYTKPSSPQKRTIPAFAAPKAQGPTPTGSTPQTSTPPPPDPSRKEALELPLELCRTVATACPGDLRKGLQVAQLLSVPGRWEWRVRKGWRMVKISCKMPKFDSWRLMFPETATKDWSIAWNYTIHGSFFGIEGLYLFISFTRFVHWRNLFCFTPLPPAKAPFLNAAWKIRYSQFEHQDDMGDLHFKKMHHFSVSFSVFPEICFNHGYTFLPCFLWGGDLPSCGCHIDDTYIYI